MTRRSNPHKRPYTPHQTHGLYALKRTINAAEGCDDWMEELGQVGQELKTWRAALITDLGGDDNISAQERSIVELATKTTCS